VNVQWPVFLACALVFAAGLIAFDQLTWGFTAFTSEAARQQAVQAQPVAVPAMGGHDQTGHAMQIASDPYAAAGETGRVAIVDFVYTRCTTLCSALGASYQRLQAQIIQAGLQDRVRLLTISFDPEHDTPAAIAAYATRMQADPKVWTVLTLDRTVDLPVLLKTFGVVVIPAPLEQFQHNAALHIVDGRGRLVRIMDINALQAALASAQLWAVKNQFVGRSLNPPTGKRA
jgi:protein SCO1/2